jgi:hypothetical protein
MTTKFNFEVKRNVSLTNKSSLNVKYYWYKENYKTTYGRYGRLITETRLIIKSRLRLDFTIPQPCLLYNPYRPNTVIYYLKLAVETRNKVYTNNELRLLKSI